MRRLSWLAVVALGCAVLAGCSSRADYFEECGRDSDCVSDLWCYTVRNAGVSTGMCSHDCFDDWDCPTASICEDIDGPWICYEICWDDFDCARGFGCYWDSVSGEDVCLPH